MVKLVRNVPSEASLECPVCGKKYKIRTTKKHINDVHKLSSTYTCVFPSSDGEICGFTCGKRISCFNNHQTRRHNVNFTELSEHKYDESTYFVLGIGEAGEDLHTPKCTEETKFFSAETMKEVRKRHRAKTGTSKIVVDEEKVDEPEAEVKKNSKRKAESDVSAKGAKKAKKEKLVKNTHTKSPLPQANDAEGSIPLVVITEVVDLTEEDVGGAVVVEVTKEEEVPANDIPEDTETDDDFFEQFNAQQGELSDSEDEEEGGEVTKKLEPELMYQVGGGRFAKDLHGLCKGVQAEMVRGYSMLKNNPPAWRKVVNRLRNTWHPDKNDEVFKRKSEEVFKFIENEKKRLESRK